MLSIALKEVMEIIKKNYGDHQKELLLHLTNKCTNTLYLIPQCDVDHKKTMLYLIKKNVKKS